MRRSPGCEAGAFREPRVGEQRNVLAAWRPLRAKASASDGRIDTVAGKVSKMEVIVEALGNVRQYLSGDESAMTVQVSEGALVQDALKAAGVPDDALWNASVDGNLVYSNTPLKNGDRVLLFAPIGGG